MKAMKVSYKVGRGKAVLEFTNDESMTMDEIVKLLEDPSTLKITITKMGTAEYLKKVGPVNK